MLSSGLSVVGPVCIRQDLLSDVGNEKTGCLGYIGDYTIQLYGDYDKPL